MLLVGLIGSSLLTACNSGSSNNGATPVVNSSPLAQYKAMLKYTSTESNNKHSLRAAGATKQQAFTVANGTTLNILEVRVTLFNSNNCQYGSTAAIITMSGGATGVDFTPGTYTSSNASNLALQNRFSDESGYQPLNAQSIRFDYHYNTNNGGPGWVSTDCMSSTGIGNYESNPAICSTGSACGFNQSSQQTAVLPETYRRAIFVTTNTHTGNFAELDTTTNNGFVGANKFCEIDSAKPAQGAGSQWRALLATNNSTISGIAYYRADYSTLIAIADGPDLRGFGDNSELEDI